MKLRKFAAITLALVMVFAMSANAFAAGNSTTSETTTPISGALSAPNN